MATEASAFSLKTYWGQDGLASSLYKQNYIDSAIRMQKRVPIVKGPNWKPYKPTTKRHINQLRKALRRVQAGKPSYRQRQAGGRAARRKVT